MQREIPIPRYTISSYKQWEGDWELIGGYPYVMSASPWPPLPIHQINGRKFITVLSIQLDEVRKGCDSEVLYGSDGKIDNDNVLHPDVMVVCGPFDKKDLIQVPPVLIVEVFSALTWLKDKNIKFNLYQQCGVRYYLMADPDAKIIEAFELANSQYAQIKEPFNFSLTKSCVVSLTEERIFAA